MLHEFICTPIVFKCPPNNSPRVRGDFRRSPRHCDFLSQPMPASPVGPYRRAELQNLRIAVGTPLIGLRVHVEELWNGTWV